MKWLYYSILKEKCFSTNTTETILLNRVIPFFFTDVLLITKSDIGT